MALKLLLVLLVLLVLVVTAVAGQLEHFNAPFFSQQHVAFEEEAPTSKFTNLSEALAASEKAIAELKDAINIPSVTFGFSIRGKPILKKALGLLDLENGVPANPSSIYRLASISKTFTSVLIGRLVDQGLVKYTDPLSQYLKPNIYPTKTWAGKPVTITIGQLLSHTSGEFMTLPTDTYNFIPGIHNCTQTVQILAQKPLIFEPGTFFAYSNFGYQLLGAVIESVTNKSYPEVISEFFQQHNFTSSQPELANVLVHNRARFYMAANASSPKVNVPTSITDDLAMQEGFWAAGGLMSNVDDLLHYGQLILEAYKGQRGAILSKKTLTEMWKPRLGSFLHNATHIPLGIDYGYGWALEELDAKQNPTVKHLKFVFHNGGLAGTSTRLVIYPEEEVVGVALSNKGDVHAYLEKMIIQTMENVFDFV